LRPRESATRLKAELFAAARSVELSERHLSSRGFGGSTVLTASSKRETKATLDRSPDHLYATAMAIWVDSARESAGGYATTAENVVVL
jgi:hypothetical protein